MQEVSTRLSVIWVACLFPVCRYAAGVAKFGDKAHVLVNNAALFVFESVETASAEDWDRSAAVNIKGHALATKHCIPLMKVCVTGCHVTLHAVRPCAARSDAFIRALCLRARFTNLTTYTYRSMYVNSGCWRRKRHFPRQYQQLQSPAQLCNIRNGQGCHCAACAQLCL